MRSPTSTRPLPLGSVGVPAVLVSWSVEVGLAVTVTPSVFDVTAPTTDEPVARAVFRKDVPSTSAWVVV
ncbi:hypothetical protein GCM10009593_29450 [Microlunatus antarcticus]